jgi:hypothetical protein
MVDGGVGRGGVGDGWRWSVMVGRGWGCGDAISTSVPVDFLVISDA